MDREPLRIALLGFGVVGGGVYEYVQKREDMEIAYVLSRRPRPELTCRVTADFQEIVSDPTVDLVVETIGGVDPAYEYARAAIESGKHFVTANKNLIAAHYRDLVELAKEKGVTLRCSAGVGGGIPWLPNLERTLQQETVTRISGIMNGTSNFILDQMHCEGLDFGDALSAAQKLGYAEADPSADLNGGDIRRKLVISANIAFGCVLREEDIAVAGIENLSGEDIRSCKKLGRVCKMIASARNLGDRVAAYIEPAFMDEKLPEAAVPLNFNYISLTGSYIGKQSFYGQGAGRYPTAYNVLQDCIGICNGQRGFYTDKLEDRPVDNSSIVRPYYVRAAHTDGWLRENIAKILDYGVILKPVSVEEMHRWAKENRCFFAALRD